jgi:peptidoglycan-associated lipoprotein
MISLTIQRRWITAIAMLAVGQTACHHQAPPQAAAPAPAPERTPVERPTNTRGTPDSDARAKAIRDSIAREDSIRSARRDLLTPVHFEFNRDEVLDSERSLLDRKAAILTSTPALAISITGNGDERGSDEYNLALGMRRAAAVMRYLHDRGVATSRLSTASNGEERPLCQDHDESCWAKNRRADIAITTGS